MDKREQDDFFDKAFKIHTRGREEYEFVHYNESMGCQIYGKEHYKQEMKRRRMVPSDVAEMLSDNWNKEHQRKEYGELSEEAREIVQAIKYTADKDGNIRLGDRAINRMVELGLINLGSNEALDKALNEGF